jgi:transcriptional regulator with XRE-family HTH domain
VYIGDRLRQLRHKKSLTQVGLAAAAKLGPSTIFHLKNNHREPKPETVEKLAQALGVEPSELVKASWLRLDHKFSSFVF